jgi:hypothetical protein
MLDQRCVGGKLRARYSTCIKRTHVFRVRAQALVLDSGRLLYQRFDLVAGLRISRLVRRIDEAVVGIFPGAQCADAIELMKQYGVQEVIDRIRIIRMPLIKEPELLDRAVVFHIIKVIKGLPVEGFLGAARRPDGSDWFGG